MNVSKRSKASCKFISLAVSRLHRFFDHLCGTPLSWNWKRGLDPARCEIPLTILDRCLFWANGMVTRPGLPQGDKLRNSQTISKSVCWSVPKFLILNNCIKLHIIACSCRGSGLGRSDELDKTALGTRLLHAATLARGRSARWGQWISVHLCDPICSYDILWSYCITHSCESCIIQSLYKDTSWATPAESCEALEVRGTLWASHSLFHQAMAPESSVPVSGPPSIA